MPDRDITGELLPDGVRVAGSHPPLALLRAWQAEALPAEIAAEVSAHAEECRLCTGLLADLDQLPVPVITAAERDRIRRSLPLLVPEERRRPSWRWYASAAAVAILTIGTVFLAVRETRHANQSAQSLPVATPAAAPAAVLPSPAAPQLQIARLDPPLAQAPGMTLRGEASSTDPSPQQMEPAFHAYNSGDYPQAIELFSQLARRYPRSATPFLYLGVSQLLVNDDRNALFSLERAARFATAAQRDDAAWYRLAASARTHAPDTAQQAHDLCASPRSRYRSQACELEKSLPSH